jgi:hypothetical protein
LQALLLCAVEAENAFGPVMQRTLIFHKLNVTDYR